MKPWIIGNWKLNPALTADALILAKSITSQMNKVQHCHLMIAPSFVHLNAVNLVIEGTNLKLAGQDTSYLTKGIGAYTGDVSATQLKDVGVEWVIIGHSERRQYYDESDDILVNKIKCCLNEGLGVVFCIGESETDFDTKQTNQILSGQMSVVKTVITQLSINSDGTDDNKVQDVLSKLIIAYEPVWAIGTGKVPDVSEVLTVHTFIREFLLDVHTDFIDMPIVYGGSIKPENVAQFARCDNVNGVLVGGAALSASSFISIAEGFMTAMVSE